MVCCDWTLRCCTRCLHSLSAVSCRLTSSAAQSGLFYCCINTIIKSPIKMWVMLYGLCCNHFDHTAVTHTNSHISRRSRTRMTVKISQSHQYIYLYLIIHATCVFSLFSPFFVSHRRKSSHTLLTETDMIHSIVAGIKIIPSLLRQDDAVVLTSRTSEEEGKYCDLSRGRLGQNCEAAHCQQSPGSLAVSGAGPMFWLVF